MNHDVAQLEARRWRWGGPGLPIYHWSSHSDTSRGLFNVLNYTRTGVPLQPIRCLQLEPMESRDLQWRCRGAKGKRICQYCVKIHAEVKLQSNYWSINAFWPRAALKKQKQNYLHSLIVRGIHVRLLQQQERRRFKKQRVGKKLSVRSSYIRLLCLWCGAKTIILRQNDRISIYDSVCGKTWARNHTLLLFFSSALSAN